MQVLDFPRTPHPRPRTAAPDRRAGVSPETGTETSSETSPETGHRSSTWLPETGARPLEIADRWAMGLATLMAAATSVGLAALGFSLPYVGRPWENVVVATCFTLASLTAAYATARLASVLREDWRLFSRTHR